MGERKKPQDDVYYQPEVELKTPLEMTVEEIIDRIVLELRYFRISSIVEVQKLGLLTEEIKNNLGVLSSVKAQLDNQRWGYDSPDDFDKWREDGYKYDYLRTVFNLQEYRRKL